ncbi:MAG: hypothetical protein SF028_03475 [Candidatus Sumerlaeia bacterium]|nr:hypothetical protein [Candidatus Sumerlaeia bacterium]
MKARAAAMLLLLAACAHAQDGESLTRDDATSATLLRQVAAFESSVEAAWRLRANPAPPESSSAVVDQARRELDALLSQTESVGGLRSVDARSEGERLRRLLQLYEGDLLARRARQLDASERLGRESAERLAALARLAVFPARGGTGADALPADWTAGEFAAPVFRSSLGRLSLADLAAESRRRLAEMERLGPAARADVRRVAVELAELARELAARSPRLMESARGGFRDTALQLDVVAENLAELAVEGSEPHFQRQIRLARARVEVIEEYLRLGAP